MSVTGIGFLEVMGCRTVRYREPSSGGFCANLNSVELAGLMSGLTDHETNLVLAKYRNDEKAEFALRAHVRVYAAGLAVRENWKIVRGKPIVYNLGGLAVFDVISPKRCSRCHGTGLLSGHACATCNGKGIKPISGRVQARFVGVDEKQWRQVWKDRYEDVRGYVLRLEASAESKLQSNIAAR